MCTHSRHTADSSTDRHGHRESESHNADTDRHNRHRQTPQTQRTQRDTTDTADTADTSETERHDRHRETPRKHSKHQWTQTQRTHTTFETAHAHLNQYIIINDKCTTTPTLGLITFSIWIHFTPTHQVNI